ncbi:gamma-glutamylcyclotransferase, partial [Mycobacterium tuberculosis]
MRRSRAVQHSSATMHAAQRREEEPSSQAQLDDD